MSYFLFMSHYCIAAQVFTQMNVSLTYNYMNGIAFFKHHNKLKNIHNNKKKKKQCNCIIACEQIVTLFLLLFVSLS